MWLHTHFIRQRKARTSEAGSFEAPDAGNYICTVLVGVIVMTLSRCAARESNFLKIEIQLNVVLHTNVH